MEFVDGCWGDLFLGLGPVFVVLDDFWWDLGFSSFDLDGFFGLWVVFEVCSDFCGGVSGFVGDGSGDFPGLFDCVHSFFLTFRVF